MLEGRYLRGHLAPDGSQEDQGQKADCSGVDREVEGVEEGWDRYAKVKTRVQEHLKALRFDTALSAIAASYGPSFLRVYTPRSGSPLPLPCSDRCNGGPFPLASSLSLSSPSVTPVSSFPSLRPCSDPPPTPLFPRAAPPSRICRSSAGDCPQLALTDGSLRSCSSLSERRRQAAAQLFNRLLEHCAFRATLPILAKAFVNSLPFDLVRDAVRELRRLHGSAAGGRKEEEALRAKTETPPDFSVTSPVAKEADEDEGACLPGLRGGSNREEGREWKDRTAPAETEENDGAEHILEDYEKKEGDEKAKVVSFRDSAPLPFSDEVCLQPAQVLRQFLSPLQGWKSTSSLVRSLFEAFDCFSRVLDTDRWLASPAYSCLLTRWTCRRQSKEKEDTVKKSLGAQVVDAETPRGTARPLQKEKKQHTESKRNPGGQDQGGRAEEVEDREPYCRDRQHHRVRRHDRGGCLLDVFGSDGPATAQANEAVGEETGKDTRAERVERRELTTLMLGFLMQKPGVADASGFSSSSSSSLPSCSSGGGDNELNVAERAGTAKQDGQQADERDRSKEDVGRGRKAEVLKSRSLFVDPAEERTWGAFRKELKRRRLRRCLELLRQASQDPAPGGLDAAAEKEDNEGGRTGRFSRGSKAQAQESQEDKKKDRGSGGEEDEKTLFDQKAGGEERGRRARENGRFFLGFDGDCRTHVVLLGAAVAVADREGERIAKEQLLLIDTKTQFLRFSPAAEREDHREEKDMPDGAADLRWIQVQLAPLFSFALL